MKVKIVKCTNSRAWYLSRIGEEFDVDNKWHDDRFYRHISKGGWEWVIRKADCIEVDDELLKPKLPKESPQMKKLNIKKDYRLEKRIVVNHISDIETEVKLLNDTADVITTIIIGRYGVNLDKANEIINLFNIPYELVDETDWSKVEDGTEITWTKVQAPDGRLGSFHSYVPSLNKVIVICGNEIKAVDSSEVELC